MSTNSSRRRVFGSLLSFSGLLLVLVPLVIFPVCGVGRFAPPPGVSAGRHGCHDTLTAEIAIGIIVFALGILVVYLPKDRVLWATSLCGILFSALAVLFPLAITGVCSIGTMPCRLGTVPGIVIASLLLGLVSAYGLELWRKKKN